MILAGDIGGTKTNLGLFEATPQGGARLERFSSYSSAEFSGLSAVVARFLAESGGVPRALRSACFGIAGPVVGNRVSTPNLAWLVEGDELAAALQLAPQAVLLINDLVATAEAIPLLSDEEVAVLQEGSPDLRGNRVLLAAGTGLGMALLPWVGEGWMPVPSEGGHADFAARTEDEIGLLRWLRGHVGSHVSVERVLSGPGLVQIYAYLREQAGGGDDALAERLRSGDPAAVITQAALAAESSLSARALEMFGAIYGAVAGSLALTATATGGVFLGGGIAPKILPALRQGGFSEAFADKGRFAGYLGRISVRVILNDRAALLGAAHCAARRGV